MKAFLKKKKNKNKKNPQNLQPASLQVVHQVWSIKMNMTLKLLSFGNIQCCHRENIHEPEQHNLYSPQIQLSIFHSLRICPLLHNNSWRLTVLAQWSRPHMQHRCTICRCTDQDSPENNLSIAASTGSSPEVNMMVKLKGPILNELMFLAFRDTV